MKVKTTKKQVKITLTFKRNGLTKWLKNKMINTIVTLGLLGLTTATPIFLQEQEVFYTVQTIDCTYDFPSSFSAKIPVIKGRHDS